MLAFIDAAVILGLSGLAVAVADAGSTTAVVPCVWLAFLTPLLVRVDLRARRLPDAVTLPGLAILLAGLGVTSRESPQDAAVATIATVTTAGITFAAALTPGFGMGDAKLATLLVGSVALVDPALVAVFSIGASASGVVLALAAVGRGGEGGWRRTRIAFGPCLLLGYWGSLVVELVG